MQLDEKNFAKLEKEVDTFGKRPFLITIFCALQYLILACGTVMMVHPAFVIKMGLGSLNSFFGLMIIFVLFFVNKGLWRMEKTSIVFFIFSYAIGSIICFYSGNFNPLIEMPLGLEAFLYLVYFNRAV